MAWDTTAAFHTLSLGYDYETQFRRSQYTIGVWTYEYRKRLITVHEERARCLTEAAAESTALSVTNVTVDGSGNINRVRGEARRADDSGQYHVHKFTTYTPTWDGIEWIEYMQG